MKDVSKTIELQEGFQKIHMEVIGDEQFIYHIDKHRSANVYLTYSGTEAQITQRFICEEGANLRVLICITANDITIQEIDLVHSDASFTIGYLELGEGTTHLTSQISLQESGAQAHFMSACITQHTKHYDIACIHEAPYTKGRIENYAIIQAHGDYQMKACGTIHKGAHTSESHQTSRVLTLSDQQQSEVNPLLLIDENDVKASHATSIGQPDEHQLYYLQTRGLTRDQALGLLTIGYLLPITELIQEESLITDLKNEIEMKVGLHA